MFLPETNPMGIKKGISLRTGKTVRGDEAYIDYREYGKICFDKTGNLKPECVDENGNSKFPSKEK